MSESPTPSPLPTCKLCGHAIEVITEDRSTPRPWFVAPTPDRGYRPVYLLTIAVTGHAGRECPIADMASITGYLTEELKQNSELIVRSVNAHAALVEALKAVRALHDPWGWKIDSDTLERIDAALALAGER